MNNYDAMMKQFNSIENKMDDYKRITRRVVKSISKSDKTNGANETCMDLVAHCFDDVIMDDLTQIVAMAIVEHSNESNTTATWNKNLNRWDMTFDTWNIDDKEVNGYVFLCSVVRKYLESNKSVKVDLVSDWTDDGDGEEASPNTISDYIRIQSMNAYICNTYDSSLNDVFTFIEENTSKDVYNELVDFVAYLLGGIKINAIAEKMNIQTSRSYWLRKKLASLYEKYNKITRRIVCFAKVDTFKTVYQIDDNGDDVLMHIPYTTFVRVYPKEATKTILGKTTKCVSYVDVYDNPIIPKDGTRVLKYVINMSEKAIGNRFYGVTSMKNAITNNGFCYSSIGSMNIATESTTLATNQSEFYAMAYDKDYDVMFKKHPFSLEEGEKKEKEVKHEMVATDNVIKICHVLEHRTNQNDTFTTVKLSSRNASEHGFLGIRTISSTMKHSTKEEIERRRNKAFELKNK